MSSNGDFVPGSTIQGTLDAAGMYVQLHAPTRYLMRRLMRYHTYEVWEAQLPAHPGETPPAHRLCLVDITIEATTVRGVVCTSAVASPVKTRDVLGPLLDHVRVARPHHE